MVRARVTQSYGPRSSSESCAKSGTPASSSAAERGTAVLVNQPFGGGGLLRKLSGRKLPPCPDRRVPRATHLAHLRVSTVPVPLLDVKVSTTRGTVK